MGGSQKVSCLPPEAGGWAINREGEQVSNRAPTGTPLDLMFGNMACKSPVVLARGVPEGRC